MAVRPHLAIRLAMHGCSNRPFFHIVVMPKSKGRNSSILEQIGSYDPMPNHNNEKLVALNFDRLKYWLGRGVRPSQPVEELLGLAGYLPVHPMTYIKAERNQKKIALKQELAAQNTDANIDEVT